MAGEPDRPGGHLDLSTVGSAADGDVLGYTTSGGIDWRAPGTAGQPGYTYAYRNTDNAFTTIETVTYDSVTTGGDITHSSGEFTVNATGTLICRYDANAYRSSGSGDSGVEVSLEYYNGSSWSTVAGTLRFGTLGSLPMCASGHAFLTGFSSGHKYRLRIERTYGSDTLQLNQAAISFRWHEKTT